MDMPINSELPTLREGLALWWCIYPDYRNDPDWRTTNLEGALWEKEEIAREIELLSIVFDKLSKQHYGRKQQRVFSLYKI